MQERAEQPADQLTRVEREASRGREAGGAQPSMGTSRPRISPELVMALQRTAGNAAVGTLVKDRPRPIPAAVQRDGDARAEEAAAAGAEESRTGRRALAAERGRPDQEAPLGVAAPSPHVPLQRVLKPEQEQAWKSANGDQVVSAVEGLVGQWKAFRARPSSFEAIGSLGSPRPLVTLLEENPQLRQHVAEKLRASIVYLQEMAGFLHTWRLLLDLVPGLSWKDPKHQYKMTASANATVNKVGYLPVQQWTIAYSNAYGWSWTRDVVTAGIQWSISVSGQAGVAGPNIPDIVGGKDDVKKKVKPGAGVSYPGQAPKKGQPGANPAIPEFAEFNILNAAVAKPVKYWGFEDMSGGAAITNGPSFSVKLSAAGGKTGGTGGMLKLHGSNGDLDFTEFKGDVTGTLGAQTPGSAKDALNLEAKVSLVSVGAVGMTTVGEASGVTAPEVKKIATAQTRTFVYTLQAFPVESAEREIPSEMIDSMQSDLSQLEDRVLEDQAGLRELGIEQDFKVAFTCDGFASRGWATAGNEAMRKRKNVELSAKRAIYVSNALEGKFGDVADSFVAIGRGPALLAPQSALGPRAGDVIAEDDTEGINRLVERYRLKWLDDAIRWEATTPSEPEQKKTSDQLLVASYEEALRFRESLMKSNPATSTAPGAQRVNVTISWKGQLIEYGTEAAGSAPTPAPAP